MILYLSIIYFYFIWNKELTITIKKIFLKHDVTENHEAELKKNR